MARPRRGRGPRRPDAEELLRRLDEPEFRERMKLSEDEANALDRIASGQYVRNAASVIAAIRLKIESAYPKQPTRLDVRKVEEFEVQYDDGQAALDLASLTALPAGDDGGPSA